MILAGVVFGLYNGHRFDAIAGSYEFFDDRSSLYFLCVLYVLCCHYINMAIGLVSREFANSLRDRGSIPGLIISKKQKSKMVLDAALISTQHYKVQINGSGAIQGKQ